LAALGAKKEIELSDVGKDAEANGLCMKKLISKRNAMHIWTKKRFVDKTKKNTQKKNGSTRGEWVVPAEKGQKVISPQKSRDWP